MNVPPISEFDIRPSRMMMMWLSMLYSLLAFGLLVLANSITWQVKVFFLVVSGYLFLMQIKKHAWLQDQYAIKQVRLSDQDWQLVTMAGKVHEVSLVNAGVVTEPLMVLYFSDKQTRRRFPVVLLPDSMSGSEHRLLRCLLRVNLPSSRG